jgi:hypothetical protein
MVELQIVILAVAGSSPVGYPTPVTQQRFLGLALVTGFRCGAFKARKRGLVVPSKLVKLRLEAIFYP